MRQMNVCRRSPCFTSTPSLYSPFFFSPLHLLMRSPRRPPNPLIVPYDTSCNRKRRRSRGGGGGMSAAFSLREEERRALMPLLIFFFSPLISTSLSRLDRRFPSPAQGLILPFLFLSVTLFWVSTPPLLPPPTLPAFISQCFFSLALFPLVSCTTLGQNLLSFHIPSSCLLPGCPILTLLC